MRPSLMARLLSSSFIALVLSLILFSWQFILDSQPSSMSLAQIAEAQTQSSQPELKNIELSHCTLYPSFTPAVTSYTCSVPFDITFITFTITADYPNSVDKIYPVTIIPGGLVGIELWRVGERTLYIDVIANGDLTRIRTYQVTVTRLPFMLNLPLISVQ